MKALLFDFGGTLDTDGVHWSEKFWEQYQHFVPALSKEQFTYAYVAAEQAIDRTAIRPHFTLERTLEKQVSLQVTSLRVTHVLPEDVAEEQLIRQISLACFEDVQRTVNRVRPLLEMLWKQTRLGLVSNFYGNLDTVCAELKIKLYFESIVDSAVVGVRKPDPEIFRIALKALGTTAEDTYIVGDSYERDILPAKLLGCTTIWLKGKSWNTPAESGEANHIISTLEDLPRVLGMLQ